MKEFLKEKIDRLIFAQTESFSEINPLIVGMKRFLFRESGRGRWLGPNCFRLWCGKDISPLGWLNLIKKGPRKSGGISHKSPGGEGELQKTSHLFNTLLYFFGGSRYFCNFS